MEGVKRKLWKRLKGSYGRRLKEVMEDVKRKLWKKFKRSYGRVKNNHNFWRRQYRTKNRNGYIQCN